MSNAPYCFTSLERLNVKELFSTSLGLCFAQSCLPACPCPVHFPHHCLAHSSHRGRGCFQTEWLITAQRAQQLNLFNMSFETRHKLAPANPSDTLYSIIPIQEQHILYKAHCSAQHAHVLAGTVLCLQSPRFSLSFFL